MSDSLRLNLTGLDRIDPKTRAEILVEMRQVLDPIFKAAGKRLIITTGTHPGDLHLEFDSGSNMKLGKNICSHYFLGEDGGQAIYVRAHRDMRVCGPTDPATGKRDTRKVLTTSWLLGPALANTAIHELGHFIADLDHVNDSTNFMSTLGPPTEARTLKSLRAFFAGKQDFTSEQTRRLVEQIKAESWLGDMTVSAPPR